MSSRRNHHHDSGFSLLKNSGRDVGHSRSREKDGPLAGGPRTYLDDMNKARNGRTIQPTTAVPHIQPTRSVLPSGNFRDETKFRTAYTAPADVKMTEKQRLYTSLLPAEQKEQDKWAHEKLKAHLSACPEGYSWVPWTQKGYEGYRCRAGGHLVTHKLLSEGQDGFYMLNLGLDGKYGSNATSTPKGAIWTHDATWVGPSYPGNGDKVHNAAYPGRPLNPNLFGRSGFDGSARQSYRGMPTDPRMIGGTHGGPMGSILPSAAFRDDTRTPDSQVMPFTGISPIEPRGTYGGRTMPKGWKPGMPDNGQGRPRVVPIKVDQPWSPISEPRDYTQGGIRPKLLVPPPEAVNDPNYRGNYKTIISDHDKAMAEKQLRFNTLSPAEQEVQKKWAKAHLTKTKTCREGFSWWSYKTDERAPDG